MNILFTDTRRRVKLLISNLNLKSLPLNLLSRLVQVHRAPSMFYCSSQHVGLLAQKRLIILVDLKRRKCQLKSGNVCLNKVSQLKKCSAAAKLASVMSDSLQPLGPQPARLLCPWDSLGKDTGVGCPFPSSGESSQPRDQTHISCLRHWQVGSSPLVPPGKPFILI